MKLCILIVLAVAGAAWGQTTKPATAPTTMQSVDATVVRLHRIIDDLKAENRNLRRQIAELLKTSDLPNDSRAENNTQGRPENPDEAFKKLSTGMTLAEVTEILGQAGGPGMPGVVYERSGGESKYYWDYASGSMFMGTKIWVWFENEKFVRAEKRFE